MGRKMKDSGIEWIGEIPEGWDIIPVKRLFNIGRGRVIAQTELIEDGLYPVYSSQTQSNGCLGFIDTYDFDRKQLTWTTDGANAGTVFLREGKHNCTNVCGTLAPKANDFLIEYTFYALSFIAEYHKRYDTNGFKIMNNEMATISITLPPQKEQQAIADYLDRKCSLIDSIIEKQKVVIEKLKLYKQSIITEAVTKGLDPSVKMKPSDIEWIGDIAEGWEVTPLTKQLDSIIDYRGKTPKKVDEGVFLVTAKNIKDGKINYEASKEFVLLEEYEEIMHRGRPEIGDVLLTTEAPLGEVANVDRTDIALAQRIIKFRACNGKLDNYYLKYWLMSRGLNSFLLSLSTGSTATGIKASRLFMLPIVLPSTPEQKAIVEYLDNKCLEIDNVINIKLSLVDKLTNYKKSLIYECVTGKREVG